MHRQEFKGFAKVARFMQCSPQSGSLLRILQERMERGAYGRCKE